MKKGEDKEGDGISSPGEHKLWLWEGVRVTPLGHGVANRDKEIVANRDSWSNSKHKSTLPPAAPDPGSMLILIT